MKSNSLRLGGAVALVGLVFAAWVLRDRFDTTALEAWAQGAG